MWRSSLPEVSVRHTDTGPPWPSSCQHHITHGQYSDNTQQGRLDWIGLSSVLHPSEHSVGYMGDSFYRSKDPTNSIKVLKGQIVHRQIKHTISRHEHKTQQVP